MRNTFLIVILAAVSNITWADDFEDGLAAALRGDYVVAADYFQKAAESGNAEAQIYLGLMYKEGKGLAKDEKEAGRRYRLAAELGNAEAQFNLGLMYYQGQGVQQDYAESVKWYRLAAEQGNGYAQANLGHMYENGLGVSKDYVRAYMWFGLAASSEDQFVAEESIGPRNKLTSLMTTQQIADAEKMTADCSANRYKGCD